MNKQPVDKLKMRKESELELLLYEQIEQAGLPLPDCQRPTQGHKFDFTWIGRRILCEVQGGTEGYGRGRGAHVREPGYSADRMRSNRRQMEGWLVLEFTKRSIENGKALELLREALV